MQSSSRVRRDAEFSAFVEAHSPQLVHGAFLLCGDRAQAEDLAQDALERLSLRWHKVDLAQPLAYARRIVLNRYLNSRRRRIAEIPRGDLPEPSPSMTSAADPADAISRHRDVLTALRELTPRERAVVVLRYHDDLTEAQAAAALGVAVGTVKSTHARALRKLRLSPDLTVPTQTRSTS